jgi:hypothetical protein
MPARIGSAGRIVGLVQMGRIVPTMSVGLGPAFAAVEAGIEQGRCAADGTRCTTELLEQRRLAGRSGGRSGCRSGGRAGGPATSSDTEAVGRRGERTEHPPDDQSEARPDDPLDRRAEDGGRHRADRGNGPAERRTDPGTHARLVRLLITSRFQVVLPPSAARLRARCAAVRDGAGPGKPPRGGVSSPQRSTGCDRRRTERGGNDPSDDGTGGRRPLLRVRFESVGASPPWAPGAPLGACRVSGCGSRQWVRIDPASGRHAPGGRLCTHGGAGGGAAGGRVVHEG